LVSILGKFSKFASVADKTAVQAAVETLSRERSSASEEAESEVTSDQAQASEPKDAPF
jgi:hypothetical protein